MRLALLAWAFSVWIEAGCYPYLVRPAERFVFETPEGCQRARETVMLFLGATERATDCTEEAG